MIPATPMSTIFDYAFHPADYTLKNLFPQHILPEDQRTPEIEKELMLEQCRAFKEFANKWMRPAGEDRLNQMVTKLETMRVEAFPSEASTTNNWPLTDEQSRLKTFIAEAHKAINAVFQHARNKFIKEELQPSLNWVRITAPSSVYSAGVTALTLLAKAFFASTAHHRQVLKIISAITGVYTLASALISYAALHNAQKIMQEALVHLKPRTVT